MYEYSFTFIVVSIVDSHPCNVPLLIHETTTILKLTICLKLINQVFISINLTYSNFVTFSIIFFQVIVGIKTANGTRSCIEASKCIDKMCTQCRVNIIYSELSSSVAISSPCRHIADNYSVMLRSTFCIKEFSKLHSNYETVLKQFQLF